MYEIKKITHTHFSVGDLRLIQPYGFDKIRADFVGHILFIPNCVLCRLLNRPQIIDHKWKYGKCVSWIFPE